MSNWTPPEYEKWRHGGWYACRANLLVEVFERIGPRTAHRFLRDLGLATDEDVNTSLEDR